MRPGKRRARETPLSRLSRSLIVSGVACKDPNNEIDRIRYVNDDPAACADLQYECRPNEEKFTDLCGCGCEAEEFVCDRATSPGRWYLYPGRQRV